ncbi:MAG: hypothetical protein LBB49_06635 [Gracilibacteraceae bacterium]|jgi:hypothetical protein|nr:hypothetical protein [Gracilibacteraceae bacterium]
MKKLIMKKSLWLMIVVCILVICWAGLGCDMAQTELEIEDGDSAGNTAAGSGQEKPNEVITSSLPGIQGLYVTSVEIRENTLLLKGVIYGPYTLSDTEFKNAQDSGKATIGGNVFAFRSETDNDSIYAGYLFGANDLLEFYVSEESGIPGGSKTYTLTRAAQLSSVWAQTDRTGEIEVEKTVSCLTWDVFDRTTADPVSTVFANFEPRTATTDLNPEQLLNFQFENGKCTTIDIFLTRI